MFKNLSFNLDSRFVKIELDKVNSFDIWITMASLGKKLKLILPSRKHKEFLKYNKKWVLKKSVQFRKTEEGKYYINVLFERKEQKKTKGKAIGLNIGYKKLIALSNGKTFGQELEPVYEKIANKKQKSKAFYRALTERDNLINQTINKLSFHGVKILVVEDLKNVKKNTKGRLRKSFVNKLQRWTYADVLYKLSCLTEEKGIEFIKVNPAYTSQTCSNCGVVCKSNRNGEFYKCACGLKIDADINASINILRLGVYSPQSTQA